jgi:hypothetical protein
VTRLRLPRSKNRLADFILSVGVKTIVISSIYELHAIICFCGAQSKSYYAVKIKEAARLAANQQGSYSVRWLWPMAWYSTVSLIDMDNAYRTLFRQTIKYYAMLLKKDKAPEWKEVFR